MISITSKTRDRWVLNTAKLGSKQAPDQQLIYCINFIKKYSKRKQNFSRLQGATSDLHTVNVR